MGDVGLELNAEKFAGNWKKFESFAWHEYPADDPDNWGIYYMENRDSTLTEQSNAKAIGEELKDFGEDLVKKEHHHHWTCGWVDGWAIRVYNSEGEITEAFEVLCDIKGRLDRDGILDDDDYNGREYDAACDSIFEVGNKFLNENVHERWTNDVFDWLWNSDYQSELENKDDYGAYPSDESVKEAMKALGLLDAEFVGE